LNCDAAHHTHNGRLSGSRSPQCQGGVHHRRAHGIAGVCRLGRLQQHTVSGGAARPARLRRPPPAQGRDQPRPDGPAGHVVLAAAGPVQPALRRRQDRPSATRPHRRLPQLVSAAALPYGHRGDRQCCRVGGGAKSPRRQASPVWVQQGSEEQKDVDVCMPTQLPTLSSARRSQAPLVNSPASSVRSRTVGSSSGRVGRGVCQAWRGSSRATA